MNDQKRLEFTPRILAGLILSMLVILPKSINGQSQILYDIPAFVWPSYHPDVMAKVFWFHGIGEWQTVISNKSKFAGYEQPGDQSVASRSADRRNGSKKLSMRIILKYYQ